MNIEEKNRKKNRKKRTPRAKPKNRIFNKFKRNLRLRNKSKKFQRSNISPSVSGQSPTVSTQKENKKKKKLQSRRHLLRNKMFNKNKLKQSDFDCYIIDEPKDIIIIDDDEEECNVAKDVIKQRTAITAISNSTAESNNATLNYGVTTHSSFISNCNTNENNGKIQYDINEKMPVLNNCTDTKTAFKKGGNNLLSDSNTSRYIEEFNARIRKEFFDNYSKLSESLTSDESDESDKSINTQPVNNRIIYCYGDFSPKKLVSSNNDTENKTEENGLTDKRNTAYSEDKMVNENEKNNNLQITKQLYDNDKTLYEANTSNEAITTNKQSSSTQPNNNNDTIICLTEGSIKEDVLLNISSQLSVADLNYSDNDESVIFVSETILNEFDKCQPSTSKGLDYIPLSTSPLAVSKMSKRKLNDNTSCTTQLQNRLFCDLFTASEYKKILKYNSNTYNPNKELNEQPKRGKRMVLIDGSNVAFHHALNQRFSVKGLEICLEYFEKMGHEVKAIVTQYRLHKGKSSDPGKIDELYRAGKLVLTPCKNLPGKYSSCYDDRFILQLACEFDAAIVSNDNYRDLINENPAFKKIIENRVIGYTWCNDIFILPKDPYGRLGPHLSTILNRI